MGTMRNEYCQKIINFPKYKNDSSEHYVSDEDKTESYMQSDEKTFQVDYLLSRGRELKKTNNSKVFLEEIAPTKHRLWCMFAPLEEWNHNKNLVVGSEK